MPNPSGSNPITKQNEFTRLSTLRNRNTITLKPIVDIDLMRSLPIRRYNKKEWMTDKDFSIQTVVKPNYQPAAFSREPFNPAIKSILEIIRPRSPERDVCKTEFDCYVNKDPFHK